ncbi:MAG TPA: YihA family ribosome biogenesis GTP-binding protein [Clostridia bacterium]|jgi:GTP-binding protein|nr:YihA family ribosome biogenesis GTP-binding protein [Clostridia bacterium]
MMIKNARLVVSAVSSAQYPPPLGAEIALVGRSNVGKSSLINCLVKRKSLARTSSTPGKTQTLNFYKINNAWYCVDLPGYGYARVSKKKRAKWGEFIEEYLNNREQLKGIIQVVDLRHLPTANDLLMRNWLIERGLPCLIIATKADKLSRNRQKQQAEKIRSKLQLTPIIFSALTSQGRQEVLAWLNKIIPSNPQSGC